MARFTPFHPRTSALSEGQAWRHWAGYVVASGYELSHDREYAAIRSGAALIDVTPLYKYRVSGKDAERLLDRVVTRDVTKLKVGQVMYTPWCDAHGKVIDDGTISRLDPETFRFTAADPSIRWLSMNAVGMDVAIEDVSDEVAALSLQGPTSRDILTQLAGSAVGELKYFRFASVTIDGVKVDVSRTGYTGDLGYELWIPAASAVKVWDALAATGAAYGMAPAGIWALDIARIEAGLIMADVDYVSSHKALIESQKSSPFELNLGWAVAVDKRAAFNGKKSLQKEKREGSAWQFVGIDVDWESLEAQYAEVGLPPRLPTIAWRSSTPLYAERRQIGYASSGCWSPLLKKYIALAHVEAPFAKPGTELAMEITVEHRRKQAAAKVAALPFFNPERKRADSNA